MGPREMEIGDDIPYLCIHCHIDEELKLTKCRKRAGTIFWRCSVHKEYATITNKIFCS